MLYYAKEIKQTIKDNMDTIILYAFGSLVCKEDGILYSDEYVFEFEEYANRVAYSFEELLKNRQFTLTYETIKFILEYELIGITCYPHEYKNHFEMDRLSMKLHDMYMDKLVELNSK